MVWLLWRDVLYELIYRRIDVRFSFWVLSLVLIRRDQGGECWRWSLRLGHEDQVVLPHALIGGVTLFLWVVGPCRQCPIRGMQNEVHHDLTIPKKGSNSQARTAAGSSMTTTSPSTSGYRHWSPSQYTVAAAACESSLSTSPKVCIHSSP
jgi:hypothetical protein